LKNQNWTREQALACFNLYCRISFGKLHKGNPEIVAFAEAIGRTPSAVAMKLVNFASFDPVHKKRNVKGLANASNLDRDIWEEFESSPNTVAERSEEAFNDLALPAALPDEELGLPQGPTETLVSRPMRLVQSFFRRSVLTSYAYKCSFCGLSVKTLLNASHIIPWKASVERRADPRNGLCLCSLHDRAFDRGLMSIDKNWNLLVSNKLKRPNQVPLHQVGLLDMEGRRIHLPGRFTPSEASLEHHRTSIFAG
jgi:putative restriction endonuclease